MEFTKIAGTGLTVSRIGLGTWAIGGWMWRLRRSGLDSNNPCRH